MQDSRAPPPRKRPAQGFTLVELAIVITIIGILIGGVLQGRELLTNAKVNATIKQIDSVRAAMISFRERYSQLPGDMANAMQRLPGCDAASYCANGNVNSIIGPQPPPPPPGDPVTGWMWGIAELFLLQSSAGINTPADLETVQAWKHLALADLITGVRPNAHPLNDLDWGVTHPSSYYSGGLHIRSSHRHVYLIIRDTMKDIPDPGPDADQQASFDRAAEYLDRKVDDGDPEAGDTRHGCAHAVGFGCITVVKLF